MAVPIEVLRNLDKFSKGWYIVADLNVLLEDLNFLKKYIVGDNWCQLMTPIKILNKLDSMSNIDPTGNARTVIKSISQLELCSRHVRYDGDVEDRSPERLDRTEDDADELLKCCQKIMAHSIHVVLLTKSRGLQTLAEIRGVYVYNLEELKSGIIKPKTDGRHIIPLSTSSRKPRARYSERYHCIRYTSSRSNHNDRHSSSRSNYNDRHASNRSNHNDRYATGERRRRNTCRHYRSSRD